MSWNQLECCRRNEEIDSLERTAPSGGVWGSKQQPPWWKELPLTMVGSVSDPVITELITTVDDSAFWAGADTMQEDIVTVQPVAAETTRHEQTAGTQPDKAADQHHTSVSSTPRAGFHFAGLTKPPSLRTQAP